jgi:hypothetical protein
MDRLGIATNTNGFELSAFFVFNSQLAENDINEIERYLALKYGLPNENIVGQTRADTTFDEMRVFNKVLTTDEIADLMDNFGQVAGTRVQVRKRNDPEPVLNTDL